MENIQNRKNCSNCEAVVNKVNGETGCHYLIIHYIPLNHHPNLKLTKNYENRYDFLISFTAKKDVLS